MMFQIKKYSEDRIVILYGVDNICSIDIWSNNDDKYVLHKWVNYNYNDRNIDFNNIGFDEKVVKVVSIDII